MVETLGTGGPGIVVEPIDDVMSEGSPNRQSAHTPRQLRGETRGRDVLRLGEAAKVVDSVRLGPDLRAEDEEWAVAEGVTTSELIQRALREYLRSRGLRSMGRPSSKAARSQAVRTDPAIRGTADLQDRWGQAACRRASNPTLSCGGPRPRTSSSVVLRRTPPWERRLVWDDDHIGRHRAGPSSLLSSVSPARRYRDEHRVDLHRCVCGPCGRKQGTQWFVGDGTPVPARERSGRVFESPLPGSATAALLLAALASSADRKNDNRLSKAVRSTAGSGS